MKKLHVKRGDKWLPVFCYHGQTGQIITLSDHDPISKALPQKAMWADSDLNYFSDKFGNHEFCLM